MKDIVRLLINSILIGIIVSTLSCSSSKVESPHNIYEIMEFDNKSLTGFNIIWLMDNNENKKLLLSEKYRSGVDKPIFEKFESIQVGKKYRINLILQDSFYVVQQHILQPSGDYMILIDGVVFIENDTIKTKVYRSLNVFDKFIEIIEK